MAKTYSSIFMAIALNLIFAFGYSPNANSETAKSMHNLDFIIFSLGKYHHKESMHINLVDPQISESNFQEVLTFQNLLNYHNAKELMPHDKKAKVRIQEFLKKNYKNNYVPAKIYDGKPVNKHLPEPLYLDQIAKKLYENIASGNASEVRAILDNFNLLEIKNSEGYSPLSYAILHRKNQVAKLLILRGANLNQRSKYGYTPLIIAAKTNNAPIIDLLLEYGANKKIADNFGKTALDYASSN